MKNTNCKICGSNIKHDSFFIDNTPVCDKCWRTYRKENGLVDSGCICEQFSVCIYRDPEIIDVRINMEDIKKVLDSAICYRGHKECIEQWNKAMEHLENIARALNGQDANCPYCNSKMKLVRTKGSSYCLCPVHGVVSHGLLKTEND
jgi:hypothetical protein